MHLLFDLDGGLPCVSCRWLTDEFCVTVDMVRRHAHVRGCVRWSQLETIHEKENSDSGTTGV